MITMITVMINMITTKITMISIMISVITMITVMTPTHYLPPTYLSFITRGYVEPFIERFSHVIWCWCNYVAVPLAGACAIAGARVTCVTRPCPAPSCRWLMLMGVAKQSGAMVGSGEPEAENLLAGQPYLDLFRCLSMSHRREKAWEFEWSISTGIFEKPCTLYYLVYYLSTCGATMSPSMNVSMML